MARRASWFADIAAACCAPDGLGRAPVDSRHAMINPWNAPVRLNVVSGLGAEIGPAQSTRRAATCPPFRRKADLQSGRMLDAPATWPLPWPPLARSMPATRKGPARPCPRLLGQGCL